MLERLAIGVDIGGTKVAAGVVDEDGQVLARLRRETPSTSAVEVEDTIAAVVTELAVDFTVGAVGIGAAGFVDETGSTVLFSPHLAWRHEPLRDAVVRRTGLPTLVENDATAAAWGEFRFGAAQNETDVICVNLGTGIGGGIVLGGQVFRGRYGLAGEFGHMLVVPCGHACPCGNRGCWEQYASGNVLAREALHLVEAGSSSVNAILAAAAGDPAAITGSVVTTAARAGDEMAIELFGEVGRWLGVGIANLAAIFDPGVFVIGGGVSEAEGLLLDPARAAYRSTLSGRGFRPEARIVRAHLGNEAGVVGAADLARTARRRRRLSRRSSRTRRLRSTAR